MITTHVLLKDGTKGDIDGDCEEGDMVTVRLHDENGSLIEVTGEVAVIFDMTITPTKRRLN